MSRPSGLAVWKKVREPSLTDAPQPYRNISKNVREKSWGRDHLNVCSTTRFLKGTNESLRSNNQLAFILTDVPTATGFPDRHKPVARISLLSSTAFLKRSGNRRMVSWQSRFYDHALRTRQEYDDVLSYIHKNPVRRGLVSEARL